MYYKPDPEIFRPEEFFPPETIDDHTAGGKLLSSIWRLIDWRILWTAKALRDRFGPMIANDYIWGGENKYRGYRPFQALIDQKILKDYGRITASWSSFTSQHVSGRALDAKFKNVSAQEVREDIMKNPDRNEYQHITCVEKGVSWLHYDVRSWTKDSSGILWVVK